MGFIHKIIQNTSETRKTLNGAGAGQRHLLSLHFLTHCYNGTKNTLFETSDLNFMVNWWQAFES
jgi:hypothetical protein